MTLLQRDPPMNWQKLLWDLVAAGYSLRSVGRAINVAESTVRDWRDGSVPNYDDGNALIKLHKMLISARNSAPQG